ncbi:GWxTD domain-containing protein [Hymenobacter sp. B81]|uniref:GWxTD domain-containing protein n=1 Tax=Hymenobacter sp. B81 TaxID=3344878 RepID=UPI0037DDCCB0
MRYVILLTALLLGAAAWPARAQRPPVPARLDLGGLYHPQRRPQAEVRREGDSLRLYLRLPDAGALRAGESLQLLGWAGYSARVPLWQHTRVLRAADLRREGAALWVELRVSAAALAPVRVLALWPARQLPDNPGAAAWLSLTPADLQRPYLLTDSLGQPLLRRYVRVGEPFGVAGYGPEQELTLRRYAADFAPARPPHARPAAPEPKARTLRPDGEETLRPGQLVRLAGPGLYTVQPAAGGPALGLLAPDGDYPNLSTAQELIAPLRYLTTSEERARLEKAEVPKRAVDAFWLRAARDQPETARLLIRRFYERVEDANQLFSAHKPGWMTDRGLLYIVLGPPERVVRSGAEEHWHYANTGYGSATYVLRAKPSTFAPDYYELVRRPEYEPLWYAAVQQWRTGLNAPRAEAGR